MRTKTYPSDLSDLQWELIKGFVSQGTMGRPRTVTIRDVVDAIFYITKTGCQWRALPSDFPNWKTVYTYFLRWRNSGKWQQIHDCLCGQVRLEAGKEATPSAAAIDSQSVKTVQKGGNADMMPAKRLKGANAI